MEAATGIAMRRVSSVSGHREPCDGGQILGNFSSNACRVLFLRRPHHRPGKTSSCRKKKCGRDFAFGLPQDLHIELMCDAGENRRWSASASPGVAFSKLPA
jgi:hypothetical protein